MVLEVVLARTMLVSKDASGCVMNSLSFTKRVNLQTLVRMHTAPPQKLAKKLMVLLQICFAQIVKGTQEIYEVRYCRSMIHLPICANLVSKTLRNYIALKIAHVNQLAIALLVLVTRL